MVSQLYNQALSVFHTLKNGPLVTLTTERRNQALAPSTFTIAEIIRLARLTSNAELVYDVMKYGLAHSTYIPIAVMSDAISLLYEKGASSLVFQLYQQLYQNKRLNHWTEEGVDSCCIDVHGYNQGMTYAAVTSAVKEVNQFIESLNRS